MNDSSANAVQLNVQRIYLKDASYETPMGVKAFQQTWKPKFNQQLQMRGNKIDDKHHEVVLTITLTALLDVSGKDETAFIVEVEQAGIFQIIAASPDVEKHILNAACPNILFPYAREAIDNLVIKGGFPAINIPLINFDALYQQALQQQTKQQPQPAH